MPDSTLAESNKNLIFGKQNAFFFQFDLIDNCFLSDMNNLIVCQ